MQPIEPGNANGRQQQWGWGWGWDKGDLFLDQTDHENVIDCAFAGALEWGLSGAARPQPIVEFE